ncbi:MAG: hypothetical protein ACE5FH_03790 [Candidatus Zixiibacteriota bacterium]
MIQKLAAITGKAVHISASLYVAAYLSLIVPIHMATSESAQSHETTLSLKQVCTGDHQDSHSCQICAKGGTNSLLANAAPDGYKFIVVSILHDVSSAVADASAFSIFLRAPPTSA